MSHTTNENVTATVVAVAVVAVATLAAVKTVNFIRRRRKNPYEGWDVVPASSISKTQP